MSYAVAATILLAVACVHAAGPSCPAGTPLGGIRIAVQRSENSAAIPLDRINRIEEGDRIVYEPALRPNEKRRGKIAIVLVASIPQADQQANFTILESQDASKPAQWTVPFRSSIAMYVYGPSGISTRKLKGFLGKDQELISQLADYAEKTAQTEAVLQALNEYDRSGGADNLGAALQGFAGQYGINAKIDRSAPLEQQTLAAFQTLNPALSAYDPISPSGMQRVSQSTGLAATVAGMFLGSTVGLAAGSTAMALNLKTLMFPDADFRSAYAQSSTPDSVVLCTSRQPQQSRKRLAYLWATRIPDTRSPKFKIEEPRHIAAGLRSALNISSSEARWKLAGRVRGWFLEDSAGGKIPVPVTAVADQPKLDINLSGIAVAPGKYTLGGLWDWESHKLDGTLIVEPLGDFGRARLTPESQNKLRQHSGKQVVTLEGADFQFVEKVTIVNRGDKYSSPVQTPFSLPLGYRRGSQSTLELQIDTTPLTASDYSLNLYQAGGQSQSVDMRVVVEPPVIAGLPLSLHEGEMEGDLFLEGSGLDRITGLAAEGLQLELGAPGLVPRQRQVRVRQSSKLPRHSTLDLRVSVQGYGQPLVFANALQVKAPRPSIREVSPSLPSDLQITLRPQELPAGTQIGILLQVTGAGAQPSLRLGCKNVSANSVDIKAGAESEGVKLNAMQTNTLFLSLDPGLWPGGCLLSAVLKNTDGGESEPRDTGRVVRLPRIDEFRLTEEQTGDGHYAGILTGRDLELVGKTGWDAQTGHEVLGLPTPIAGEGNKQSLRIRVPWPSPTPRSPLFIWFRGEDDGRATTIRY